MLVCFVFFLLTLGRGVETILGVQYPILQEQQAFLAQCDLEDAVCTVGSTEILSFIPAVGVFFGSMVWFDRREKKSRQKPRQV